MVAPLSLSSGSGAFDFSSQMKRLLTFLAVPVFLALTGADVLAQDLNLRPGARVRMWDADGSHWIGFEAPPIVPASVSLKFPTGAGSAGQVLTSDGAGNMNWAASGGVSDGDKGDIIVSAGGASWLVDPSSGLVSSLLNAAGGAAPVQGQILYRNPTAWVKLDPGVAGQVLTTGGTGANPAWATVSSAGAALVSTQVGYGSAANQMTSEAAFNYSESTNRLTVPNIFSTTIQASAVQAFGFQLFDAGSDHTLTLDVFEDLTTNRTLYISVGDSDRAISVPSNLTVAGRDISNAWADGVKQIFNPNSDQAGINVGAHTEAPFSLTNGDLWYNSTSNELHARINGATVALGAGSGAPSLTATYVGYGGTGNTLTGESDFIYDPASNMLIVPTIVATSDMSTGVMRAQSFRVNDTASDHALGIISGEDFTDDRTLVVNVGNTNRTITIPGDLVLAGVNASNSWADGVKQTFNPNGTNAGINAGSHTADPSTLANGDLWYNSTTNALNARIGGSTVSLGAGAGAAALTATYVGYGGAGDEMTGEADFNYNAATNTLSVPGFLANSVTTSGLHILDAGSDHSLSILLNEDFTADQALTLILLDDSHTVTIPATLTVAGADIPNAWADGVRQTFNPDGTSAGLNVGAFAGNPSAPENGDLWYNSSTNALTTRANGITAAVPTSRTGVRRTIYVNAGAMIPRATNGAAPGTTELATNDIMIDSLDFDTATEEGVGFWLAFPTAWNQGAVTARFHWTYASGTGTVKWDIAGRCYNDADAIDAAPGVEQTPAADTGSGVGLMHVTGATPAITVAGTPAANRPVYFQVTRDVAGDTLSADAKLLGVTIEYTESATEPAAQ